MSDAHAAQIDDLAEAVDSGRESGLVLAGPNARLTALVEQNFDLVWRTLRRVGVKRLTWMTPRKKCSSWQRGESTT